MITIMLAIITSLVGAVYLLLRVSPSVWYARPLLLILVGIAVEGILSSLLFIIDNKKSPSLTNYRKIYRKSLKKVLPITILLIGLLGMRLYQVLTPLTGILLVILLSAVIVRQSFIRD